MQPQNECFIATACTGRFCGPCNISLLQQQLRLFKFCLSSQLVKVKILVQSSQDISAASASGSSHTLGSYKGQVVSSVGTEERRVY